MPSIQSTILALLATTSTSVLAAPLTSASSIHPRSAPTLISGPWTSFPSMSTWLSYDDLFALHQPFMLQTGSTQTDTEYISNAVQQLSSEKSIDPRVLLAMIMQESHGDVGAPVTYSPTDNIPTGGLMQCYNCNGYPGQHGLTQDQITEQVRGGAEHYLANCEQFGSLGTEETYYPALRAYNSGENAVDETDLSNGMGATDEYVSDVSQRLTGAYAD